MKIIIKSKFFPVYLLVLISIVFLYPLILDNFYLSHDGEAHVARFAAYYKAFTDGQFPLRWAGDLNYGYGSPVFTFYYPFPGLLSIPIHALGITFENTFKLLISFFFILSFLTFYLWASGSVKKEAAFLGALFYGLAPYHILNLYVRGDVAELVALSIVPIVFWSIDKLTQTKSSMYLILGGIVYALLILSHNSISLMFSGVFLLYSFIHTKNMKEIMMVIPIFALGLALSSFFWFPALVESRYTNVGLFVGDMFKEHFPSVQQLIYPSWGFGPDVAKVGGLSPQIGIVGLVLAACSMGLIFRFKEKKRILFWMGVLISAIFMSLSTSTLIWENAPLLKFFQFPWRIVGLSSFAAAVLSIYFSDKFLNKRLIIVFSILILLFSAPFIKIKSTENKNDSFYLSYKGTTDYHGAASTIWTAGDFSSIPKIPYEVIVGKAKISLVKRKSNVHEFNVDASTNLKIVDNTVYFPGWQVAVDGNKVPIQFQDPNYRGLITFNVSRGTHNIKVMFGESPIRLLADFISLAGSVFVIALFIWRSKIDKAISKLWKDRLF